jgi:hypothetical protein
MTQPGDHGRHQLYQTMPIEQLAQQLGAKPSDIPGLWMLPGFPELTINQLRFLASADAAGPMRLDQLVSTLLAPKP